MIRCMNVDEARGVFKDRSRWRSVVSAYPMVESLCMYVCRYILRIKSGPSCSMLRYKMQIHLVTRTDLPVGIRPAVATCSPHNLKGKYVCLHLHPVSVA